MKSFNEFLSETAVETRRQGITHLQDMKPAEFVAWLKSIKSIANGVLKDHKVVMKVDGLGARFGKDVNGKIFFEGSRTGPVFEVGSFSQYAINKGSVEEIVKRSIHYDNMLSLFQSAKLMKGIPDDTKIVCEIFYNPMAEEREDGIVFVTVKYDKAKLGSLMTILPYTVLVASTGIEHPNKDQILKYLLNNSTSEIKVIDPNLKLHSIDISAFINPIETISNMEVLQSRRAADKPERTELLNFIQKVKHDLTMYILDHPGIEGKFKLGPDIEGIVLHVNNSPYKLITPSFKESHRSK